MEKISKHFINWASILEDSTREQVRTTSDDGWQVRTVEKELQPEEPAPFEEYEPQDSYEEFAEEELYEDPVQEPVRRERLRLGFDIAEQARRAAGEL